jgi:hypothetical protein
MPPPACGGARVSGQQRAKDAVRSAMRGAFSSSSARRGGAYQPQACTRRRTCPARPRPPCPAHPARSGTRLWSTASGRDVSSCQLTLRCERAALGPDCRRGTRRKNARTPRAHCAACAGVAAPARTRTHAVGAEGVGCHRVPFPPHSSRAAEHVRAKRVSRARAKHRVGCARARACAPPQRAARPIACRPAVEASAGDAAARSLERQKVRARAHRYDFRSRTRVCAAVAVSLASAARRAPEHGPEVGAVRACARRCVGLPAICGQKCVPVKSAPHPFRRVVPA